MLTRKQIELAIGYRFAAETEEIPAGFKCECCNQHHRFVGSRTDLWKNNGTAERKAALFCVVCVATGRAYNEKILPNVQVQHARQPKRATALKA